MFKVCPMFPPELVERILYFCDGCTLTRARGVCRLWKQSADFLIKKRHQMTVCCEREIGAATLSELSAQEGDWAARYRVWYLHSRLAHWPVTQLPPLEMSFAGAMTVTCIDGDCIVVAGSSSGVSLFDMFGNLLYELPHWDTRFPISQLEVSRPLDGLNQRRLMVVAYSNNLVRVGGFCHDKPDTMSTLIPLLTHQGVELTVSVCEDLVCVSYRSEVWLYRIRLGKGTVVDAVTIGVVDLRSADSLKSFASCCRDTMAYVALRAGGLVWCDARDDRGASARGSLPYPPLRLTPRRSVRPPLEPASDLHPDDIRALHFNTVNVVASLGTEVVLGHAELGCRTVDAFCALRSRVSACLLHGRLLLLGTENGTLAVYFVADERALPEVDLSRPAGRLKLTSEPLQRLFVVDQTETVRVLALDTAGVLHHCCWRRPGAGYEPSDDSDAPLEPRLLLRPSD